MTTDTGRPKLAAVFLSGAISRLLPASIPMRYFGAATVFHVAAWIALGIGAARVPRFAGGLDWPLAALHLITLGVLAMTAIGASLQLMPVATRQPVYSTRLPAWSWWFYTAGVLLTTYAMATGAPVLLGIGATGVVAGLLVYGALTARNLAGARGMAGIVAHGWIAIVSLALVLISALALVLTWSGHPFLPRDVALAVHVPMAAWGFMGMLALGLACVLVPMFAIAAAPDETRIRQSAAAGGLALALAAIAAFGIWRTPLLLAALLAAAVSVTIHLRLMAHTLRTGMRRELGRSFRLVRISWGLLVASLFLALAHVLAPDDGLVRVLFGIVLIPGWLLTMVLGILQRIVPFLASMHKAPGSKRPRTPASLTADAPLAVHYHCHLAAFALLVLAALTGSRWLVLAASAVGTIGALAFLVFFIIAMHRMRTPPAAAAGTRPNTGRAAGGSA